MLREDAADSMAELRHLGWRQASLPEIGVASSHPEKGRYTLLLSEILTGLDWQYVFFPPGLEARLHGSQGWPPLRRARRPEFAGEKSVAGEKSCVWAVLIYFPAPRWVGSSVGRAVPF